MPDIIDKQGNTKLAGKTRELKISETGKTTQHKNDK
jgi:hypothetical protein